MTLLAGRFELLDTRSDAGARTLLCWDTEAQGPAVLQDGDAQWSEGAERAAAIGLHPHLVGVREVLAHDGKPLLWLADLWPDGVVTRPTALDPLTAARLMLAVARAMNHARRRVPRLVHGSLTAEHLCLDPEGAVHLTGLGWPHTAPAEHRCPEAWRGEDLDARGDLYTLASTLVALLTGRPPVEGTDEGVLRTAHLTGRTQVPSAIPAPLREVLEVCLRLRVAERLPGWDALERRASRAVEGLGRTPPPPLELDAPPPQSVTAALWLQTGLALSERDPARALTALRNATRKAETGDVPELLARAEVAIAGVLLALDRPGEAEPYILRGLPRAQQYAPEVGQQAALHAGRVALAAGESALAESQLTEAASGDDDPVAAFARLLLARLAASQGQTELASQLLDAAWEDLDDDDQRAEAALLRARLNQSRGTDAVADFELAQQLAHRAGKSDMARQAEEDRLDALLASDRAHEAVPLLERELETARARGDARLAARTHERLGRVLVAAGSPSRAAKAWALAAQAWESIGEAEPTARALLQAAHTHQQADEAPRALAVLHTVWERGHERGETLSLLEDLLSSLPAPRWVTTALDAAVADGDDATAAQLAGLLGRTTDGDDARSLLQMALAAARRNGEPRLRMTALLDLGGWMSETSWPIALPLLAEACEEAAALGEHAAREDALVLRARGHAALGEGQAALDAWRARLDSARERAAADRSAVGIAARSALSIAQLLRDAGDHPQAAQYAQYALTLDPELTQARALLLD